MYESKLKSESMDALLAAIARLENEEERYRFFEDLCTISELQAMAQRYEVARMLKKGFTYNVVAEKTGASSATISRVNRCLLYGEKGYSIALEREEEQEKQQGQE